MKTHLNTLFITLEGAYLRKDGAAVEIRHDGKSKLRVPLHNLEGIVTYGWDTTVSASLMAGCHEYGVSLTFLSPHGKFISSSYGGVSGNILLRREQYRHAESEASSLAIARNMITAKIHNTRTILQRAARDHGTKCPQRAHVLTQTSDFLFKRISACNRATNLDSLRGIEGESAAAYFAVFNHLITIEGPAFLLNGRTKRPPLDRTNALLSFLYVLLAHDCRSACETVGLDPQSGFLHQPRPGRHSLALDLMEEFRPLFADRLALSLINRQQVKADDFELQENGATFLKPDSRKKILTAWQERKQETFTHPFLDETITYGLLPQIQARLLARYLRGDHDAYPAYLHK
ncbi:type I-C CRISPR-associated endonuclease Cas1c [Luteolibacter algae]|uniref:CRISPR-associated endonuclease Cas1 n=1 Tax=Luteolibacter algae TaxID=454151 RepID=A0ABW5D8K1_9BACT